MEKKIPQDVLREFLAWLEKKDKAASGLAELFPPSLDDAPVLLARSGLERAANILRGALGRGQADLATPAEAARLLSDLVGRLRQGGLIHAPLIDRWVAEIGDRRP